MIVLSRTVHQAVHQLARCLRKVLGVTYVMTSCTVVARWFFKSVQLFWILVLVAGTEKRTAKPQAQGLG
jgi:hypothetical protein